jgi:hypothetical protein
VTAAVEADTKTAAHATNSTAPIANRTPATRGTDAELPRRAAATG